MGPKTAGALRELRRRGRAAIALGGWPWRGCGVWLRLSSAVSRCSRRTGSVWPSLLFGANHTTVSSTHAGVRFLPGLRASGQNTLWAIRAGPSWPSAAIPIVRPHDAGDLAALPRTAPRPTATARGRSNKIRPASREVLERGGGVALFRRGRATPTRPPGSRPAPPHPAGPLAATCGRWRLVPSPALRARQLRSRVRCSSARRRRLRPGAWSGPPDAEAGGVHRRSLPCSRI